MPRFNSLAYLAQKAGWLLACDAPKNIAKGEKINAELDAKHQKIADDYKAECLATYAGAKS